MNADEHRYSILCSISVDLCSSAASRILAFLSILWDQQAIVRPTRKLAALLPGAAHLNLVRGLHLNAFAILRQAGNRHR